MSKADYTVGAGRGQAMELAYSVEVNYCVLLLTDG